MATSTIVITYSGTAGTSEKVTSYTVGGTAYDTLTASETENARRLLLQASKLTGGTSGGYKNWGGRAT